ncbi:dihydrolipoamide dehydrogenase, partial [Reticulomyxa filosa]
VDYAKGWGKITGKNQVTVKLADGKEEKITTKNIVIATGSESSKLPGVDIDEKDIVSSTGALSFAEVPKKLVVVGAGVIGLELGSVWSRLGSEVTIVEYLDRILPGIDNDVAARFHKILQKQGLKFKLGAAVQLVKKEASGYNIVVKDQQKGTQEALVADKVLIAIGRRPYTNGLGIQVWFFFFCFVV